MNKYYFIFLVLLSSNLVFSQSECTDAVPFCNDFGSPATVVNGGNAEVGPDYGCLSSTPNPSWSLLKIQSAGTMELEILQVNSSGSGIDVDYICYGPFNDPATPCNSSQLTAANTIDCSFSGASVEYLTIPNAQVGEYYLILITNYSGVSGTLTFTQTNEGFSGAGESDCSIVCNVALDNDTSICINNDFTLVASMGNSSVDPVYKWFKNGLEIVGETTDSIVINSSIVTTDIYKVIASSDTCEDDTEDEIVVNYVDVIPNFKLNDITTIEECDNDNDGFNTFDLTENIPEIANLENPLDYTFTFFTDDNLTQTIIDPTAFTNLTSYTQTIYVTATHNNFVRCDIDTQFGIKAIDSPKANQIDDWFLCDDDNDGFMEFDLETLLESIYNGQDIDKYSVSFHNTQDDADTNINQLNLLYTNTNAFDLEEVFIRIENNAIPTCFETSSFHIKVVYTPVSNPIQDWIVCDNQDNDGFYAFDFTTLTSVLLSGQDETEINISFYQSQVDADFKITPLELNYINKEAFIAEEIFVRLESNEKESCYSTSSFFIQVIENPIFDIVEQTKYICTNLTGQIVDFEVENTQGNYTYSWQDSLGNELSATKILGANQVGDYTVTATTTDGNFCTTTKTVHLLPSTPAENIQFVMHEFWEEENFSILVSVSGNGIYQYALDNENGPYQEDPLLINVSPGVHTVYVKEMNDCGISSKEIDIFGFSPFFTPNGDGKHDIWKVQGINFSPLAKIYIFDRYGKTMSQFFPALNQGWDGFYNGKPAPEGEYWFTSDITNYKGSQIRRKGHFSLIRTNN